VAEPISPSEGDEGKATAGGASLAEAALDALAQHLAILDQNGTILRVNRAWREFAATNAGEGAQLNEGVNYLKVCDAAQGPDSEEAAAFGAGLRAVLEGRKAEFLLEYPCHSPVQQRWFQGRVVRFWGVDQQPCLVVSHIDITDRKLAEQQVQERAQQLRIFVERAPAAIALLDTQMRYLSVSHRWLEDYRLPDPAILGKSHYEVFPEIPERWKEVHRRCLAGASEQCEEDPFPRADGTTDWIRWEIQPWHQAEGSIGGIVLFSEVITEQVLARDRLQRSQAMLARAERIAHLGSWEWNATTGAVTWSDEMFRILQWDPADGAPSREDSARIFPTEEIAQLKQAMEAAIQEGRPYELELHARRPDGKVRILTTRGVREVRFTGQGYHLAGSCQDITEQRESEQRLTASHAQLRLLLARLRRAQEDERIRVARQVHDDLGQLLTTLKLSLDWLERRLSDSLLHPEGAPLLDKVLGASELVDLTVKAVQGITAELRPSTLDNLGLEAALRQEARQFTARTGLSCSLVVDKFCSKLAPGSSNELFYICREALTNVMRHAQARGVEIRLHGVKGACLLEVCDDGIGMTGATSDEPSSLGLLGMKERALQCGGTISFEPNSPRGTRVIVHMPWVAPAGAKGGGR
jgi:PAS domain S-box-containing protein